MKTLANLALAILLLKSAFAITAPASSDAGKDKPAFVASSSREPFHKPTCEWAKKISFQNFQAFKTREEAIKAGHRPCKVCKP